MGCLNTATPDIRLEASLRGSRLAQPAIQTVAPSRWGRVSFPLPLGRVFTGIDRLRVHNLVLAGTSLCCLLLACSAPPPICWFGPAARTTEELAGLCVYAREAPRANPQLGRDRLDRDVFEWGSSWHCITALIDGARARSAWIYVLELVEALGSIGIRIPHGSATRLTQDVVSKIVSSKKYTERILVNDCAARVTESRHRIPRLQESRFVRVICNFLPW
jgi:hypothetical protein